MKLALASILFCVISISVFAMGMPEPKIYDDRIFVTEEEDTIIISIKTYSSPSGYKLYQVDFEWENGDEQIIRNDKKFFDGNIFFDGDFMIIEISKNRIKAENYKVIGVMLVNKKKYLEGYRNRHAQAPGTTFLSVRKPLFSR